MGVIRTIFGVPEIVTEVNNGSGWEKVASKTSVTHPRMPARKSKTKHKKAWMITVLIWAIIGLYYYLGTAHAEQLHWFLTLFLNAICVVVWIIVTYMVALNIVASKARRN